MFTIFLSKYYFRSLRLSAHTATKLLLWSSHFCFSSTFQMFAYSFSCLLTFSAVYLQQLFIYNLSCLFTILAVCLHYRRFVHNVSCLFTLSVSWLFTILAVCLHFQLFVYNFRSLFTLSVICLQYQTDVYNIRWMFTISVLFSTYFGSITGYFLNQFTCRFPCLEEFQNQFRT